MGIASDKSNSICADCLHPCSDSNWVAWNHGVFICIKCSGIHRQMGVDISKVKSTQYDKWRNNELQHVIKCGGNAQVNLTLEQRKPHYFISIAECSQVEAVRTYYIRQKYEKKIFQTEQKNDAGTYDMPQKIKLGTFFDEHSKKKKYFQIVGRFLYFFKQHHDSYDFEHYEVTTISANICFSDSNYTDFVLN